MLVMSRRAMASIDVGGSDGPPIQRIVHVADLHIRLGAASRTDEYECVFERLIHRVQELSCSFPTIVVVAGDVFHNKGRLDATSGKHAFQWFNQLLDAAPVFVICGNHDYRQDEPDVPDAIEMLEAPYRQGTRPHQLHYLRETGVYRFRNLEVSVVSIKSTLIAHGTSGTVPIEQLPAFPRSAAADRSPGVVRIALFHGTVRTRETSLFGGYPMEWFVGGGFDALLLGDNHRQQVQREPSTGMLWGYPGSLVQQDFGEPRRGHGYLLWTVTPATETPRRALSVEAHHLDNPCGFVTLKQAHLDLSPEALRELVGDETRRPRVRVVVDASSPTGACELERKTRLAMQEIGCECVSVKAVFDRPLDAEEEAEAGDRDGGNCATRMAIADAVSPQTLRAFVGRDLGDEDEDWVLRPCGGSLMVPATDAIPAPVAEQVAARNSRIQNAVDAYQAELAHERAATRDLCSAQSIERMAWSDLMCYGEGNVVDFGTVRRRVVLLSGPNAVGKTSFLDVLCLALFGDPTPARSGAGQVVRHGASRGSVSLWLEGVDGSATEDSRKIRTRHLIHREFARAKNGTCRATAARVVRLSRVEGGQEETLAEGVRKTNEWLSRWVGSPTDLLMSTVLCQNAPHDFFDMKAIDQCAILDRVARLSTISMYEQLLRESIRGHVYIAAQMNAYIAGIKAMAEVEEGGGVGEGAGAGADGTAPADAYEDTEVDIDSAEAAKQALQRDAVTLATLTADATTGAEEISWTARIDDTGADGREREQLPDVGEVIARIRDLSDRKDALASEIAGITCRLDMRRALDSEIDGDGDGDGAESEGCDEGFLPEPERVSIVDLRRAYGEEVLARARAVADPTRLAVAVHSVRVEIDYLLRVHGVRLGVGVEDIDIDIDMGAAPEDRDRLKMGVADSKDRWDRALGCEPMRIDAIDLATEVADWVGVGFGADASSEGNSEEDHAHRNWNDAAFATWRSSSWDPWRRDVMAHVREHLTLGSLQRLVLEREIEALKGATQELNPACPVCMRQPQQLRLDSLRAELQRLAAPEVPRRDRDAISDEYLVQHMIPARRAYDQKGGLMQRERTAWIRAARSAVDSSRSHRLWTDGTARPALRELLRALRARLTDLELRARVVAKLEASRRWTVWLRGELAARRAARARLHDARRRMAVVEGELGRWRRVGLEVQRSVLAPAMARLDVLISRARSNRRRTLRLQCAEQLLDRVQGRAERLQRLLDRLVGGGGAVGYKDHVYETLVLPMVEAKMNEFVAAASPPPPAPSFRVRVRPSDKTRIRFSIVATKGVDELGLDHASGFQRFLVALAMRMSLVALGGSRAGLRHLFLDEGFTACDAANLARAGELLQELVSPWSRFVLPLDSIVVMSHLDAIQDAAHVRVPISFDPVDRISKVVLLPSESKGWA